MWTFIAVASPILLLFLLAMRGSRIRAKHEFEADLRQRQIDTLQGDIRRAEQIEKEVEVAKKTVLSGDLDLSDRLRQSGRSRSTK